MKNNIYSIETLKESYSINEAKEIIDRILSVFGKDCSVNFTDYFADIINSYKVTSKKARHLVCEIIRRTGITNRSKENLSAEWQVHNAAWYMGVAKSHAKDASLDYTQDPRKYVRVATSVFEVLGA